VAPVQAAVGKPAPGGRAQSGAVAGADRGSSHAVPGCADPGRAQEACGRRRGGGALDEHEWSSFVTEWMAEPIGCIRAINQAILGLQSPKRILRYLEAAVELETLMDRGAIGGAVEQVQGGHPRLHHGWLHRHGPQRLASSPQRSARRSGGQGASEALAGAVALACALPTSRRPELLLSGYYRGGTAPGLFRRVEGETSWLSIPTRRA
jgi:hypothetical protein